LNLAAVDNWYSRKPKVMFSHDFPHGSLCVSANKNENQIKLTFVPKDATTSRQIYSAEYSYEEINREYAFIDADLEKIFECRPEVIILPTDSVFVNFAKVSPDVKRTFILPLQTASSFLWDIPEVRRSTRIRQSRLVKSPPKVRKPDSITIVIRKNRLPFSENASEFMRLRDSFVHEFANSLRYGNHRINKAAMRRTIRTLDEICTTVANMKLQLKDVLAEQKCAI
jgi:hypothetical protein